MWIDRSYVPAGYGWSFPAGEEIRVGVGSFDPRFHVKEPTVRLAEDLDRDPVRYQGNWIPHRDPRRHRGRPVLRRRLGRPLPAADRRGHSHRPVLRDRVWARAPRRARGAADPRAGARPLPRVQRVAPVEVRVDAPGPAARPAGPAPRARRAGCAGCAAKRFVDWSFGHYLKIAPPEFAGRPRRTASRPRPRSSEPRPCSAAALSRRLSAGRQNGDRSRREGPVAGAVGGAQRDLVTARTGA